MNEIVQGISQRALNMTVLWLHYTIALVTFAVQSFSEVCELALFVW